MTPLTPQQMRAFLTYLRDEGINKVSAIARADEIVTRQIECLEQTETALARQHNNAVADVEAARRLLDALNKNEPTPVAYFVEGQAIAFDYDGKVSVFVATTIPPVSE